MSRRRRISACGGRILRRTWSGGVSVLVDEAVASGGLDDLEPGWIGFSGRWWQRWSLLEGAVRPVGVVMVDVVDVVDSVRAAGVDRIGLLTERLDDLVRQ